MHSGAAVSAEPLEPSPPGFSPLRPLDGGRGLCGLLLPDGSDPDAVPVMAIAHAVRTSRPEAIRAVLDDPARRDELRARAISTFAFADRMAGARATLAVLRDVAESGTRGRS